MCQNGSDAYVCKLEPCVVWATTGPSGRGGHRNTNRSHHAHPRPTQSTVVRPKIPFASLEPHTRSDRTRPRRRNAPSPPSSCLVAFHPTPTSSLAVHIHSNLDQLTCVGVSHRHGSLPVLICERYGDRYPATPLLGWVPTECDRGVVAQMVERSLSTHGANHFFTEERKARMRFLFRSRVLWTRRWGEDEWAVREPPSRWVGVARREGMAEGGGGPRTEAMSRSYAHAEYGQGYVKLVLFLAPL